MRTSPLHLVWFSDVLEDHLASSVGLVLHELHSVLSLFIGRLLEVLGVSMKSLFVSVEPRAHGEIDVAGVELHVDLLVDGSLGLLVEVLPDSLSHLDLESLIGNKNA